jgi:hypothetical protein
MCYVQQLNFFFLNEPSADAENVGDKKQADIIETLQDSKPGQAENQREKSCFGHVV